MARILIADADKSVRDLVRLRLTAWGHDVVSFADGQSALQAWREDRFDLTLLAADLPRISGIDALRTIRTIDPDGEFKVVVMGAEAETSQATLAYLLGADEFVVKPLTLSFVTSLASSLLAESAARLRDAVPA